MVIAQYRNAHRSVGVCDSASLRVAVIAIKADEASKNLNRLVKSPGQEIDRADQGVILPPRWKGRRGPGKIRSIEIA